ncbi:MAG: RNB domain-containing ribonuclease, partial [Acidobacteriaceae bacterium]|nr:RNB domain-containing ribonuclease [Acidobacteriaceae bacterium]
MIHEGFDPDFSDAVRQQVASLEQQPPATGEGLEDLRDLVWSSIDNDTSRDLDQIEYAERVAEGIRVLIGIADVTAEVALGSPIDEHARSQTTTVYTTPRVFPMLPEELSTDLTSLEEAQDRAAIVIEMVVAPDGSIVSSGVRQALVRNKAQLAYGDVGSWLEGQAGPPAKVAASADLQSQLQLQNEAARAMRQRRVSLGALRFDRIEPQAVITNGHVTDIAASPKNKANDLIEDFMVGANEVMARLLKDSGVSSIRRVVRSPERWARIVELAARYGTHLPEQPDSGALNAFLMERRNADRLHYPDLSLAVLKLMGPGEYVMAKPGDAAEGHFGLAANDYTHSTAPNRRFADMVVQRMVKSVIDKAPPPYADDELADIARNCTLKEDAARKVERTMNKRVAAVALQ